MVLKYSTGWISTKIKAFRVKANNAPSKVTSKAAFQGFFGMFLKNIKVSALDIIVRRLRSKRSMMFVVFLTAFINSRL